MPLLQMPQFPQQCCDANFYLWMGKVCAERPEFCWHPIRPMGAQLYYSLPHRLGLQPTWTIVLNAVLVCVSAVASAVAMSALMPALAMARSVRLGLIVAVFGIHLLFFGGTLQNSLSDLPAGTAALLAIWGTVLAAVKGKGWRYAATGIALGMSAWVRSFYLYPALVFIASLLVLVVFRKPSRLWALLLAVAFAIPTSTQLAVTYRHTGRWSFIDDRMAAEDVRAHFETVAYGYDTFVRPFHAKQYDASSCFSKSSNAAEALRARSFDELLCLTAYRQWFYFGSYTTAGRVYLFDTETRHFSLALFVANVAAVTAALAWLIIRGRNRPQLIAIPVFLGAIWGEGTIIRPEARFLLAFHVATWVFALAGAAAACGAVLRGKVHSRRVS